MCADFPEDLFAFASREHAFWFINELRFVCFVALLILKNKNKTGSNVFLYDLGFRIKVLDSVLGASERRAAVWEVL